MAEPVIDERRVAVLRAGHTRCRDSSVCAVCVLIGKHDELKEALDGARRLETRLRARVGELESAAAALVAPAEGGA